MRQRTVGTATEVRRKPTRPRCVGACLLFAIAAVARAQTAPATGVSENGPAAPQNISYVDGQLRINVLNSTLTEVLAKVAALTGVKIEIPEGVSSERMPVFELGPGPARQVLATLLSDSEFDYLIQGSDTSPDKIQSVVLMPRGKKDAGSNGNDALARAPRSPYARAAAVAAPAPVTPAPAQPEDPAAIANPVSPQPAQPEQQAPPDPTTPPPPAQPDPSTQLPGGQVEPSAPYPTGQPLQTNVPKVFPGPVPAVLNQQTINQQLQQMYQQRMQMVQQERQSGSPGDK